MSIMLIIRNRLLVCALVLMLAPLGISVPTLVRAAQPEESVATRIASAGSSRVIPLGELRQHTLGHVRVEPAYGGLYTGGTVALHDTLWDLRPSDGRADRPYQRP
jgi:hypothetical protein